jgi:hypothetical protein
MKEFTHTKMSVTRMVKTKRFQKKKLAKMCLKCPILAKKLRFFRQKPLATSRTVKGKHGNAPETLEKSHITDSEALPQQDAPAEDENTNHIRGEASNDVKDAKKEDTTIERAEAVSSGQMNLDSAEEQ